MDSPKKIFLVDDEIGIIQSLKRELFPWAIENNFAIATAQSGTEALARVKDDAENIALVISDIKMPDMRGSDLLLEVNKLFPDIMTILLTGYAETEDMLKAIKAGIFSYILKPWDRFYLIGEVKKALDIYTLKEENRRNVKRMQEELRWAGELQRRILDTEPVSTPWVSLDIQYEPMQDLVCGGDYYDVISSGDDRFLLAIGDVAGHGVRSAFVTTILKTILGGAEVRKFVSSGEDPSRILRWLNGRVREELRSLPDVVVPLGLCFVDLAFSRLRFANAGHVPSHIVRNGEILTVDASGPALGVVRDVVYESAEVALESGDRVVMFTDGLCRANDLQDEQSSRARVQAIMREVEDRDNFAYELIEGVRAFAADGQFTDDVTVLSMEIK